MCITQDLPCIVFLDGSEQLYVKSVGAEECSAVRHEKLCVLLRTARFVGCQGQNYVGVVRWSKVALVSRKGGRTVSRMRLVVRLA